MTLQVRGVHFGAMSYLQNNASPMPPHRLFSSLAAVGICLSACAPSHDCPPLDGPDIDVRAGVGADLDTLVRESLEGGFRGTVLVEKDGELLLHAGYGYASVEASCRAASIGTAYWIGSLSKQFAAAGIAKLMDDGRLELTDTIGDFFPDAPNDKSSITVRQLLTHTSGLPANYAADGIGERDEAVAAILAQELDSAPGETFSYSNDGFNLAAAIIEIVSGEDYDAMLQESLFGDLPFAAIGFNNDEGAWGRLDVAECALGIDCSGSPQDWPADWGYTGATGAVTTAGALRTWFHQLERGEAISRESATEMFARQADTGRDGVSYGLGWFRIDTSDGDIIIVHAGDDDFVGHSSMLRWHDNEKLLVIVLSNSGYVDSRPAASIVASELARAAIGLSAP